MAKILPQELHVGGSSGRVQQTHSSQDDRLVIVLQDAHGDPTSQGNIASIIESIHTSHGVDLVGVEGSTGFVDTTLFSLFPGKQTKEKLAVAMMQDGRVSGAELASIRTEGAVTLYGLEDPDLYLSNYDSLVRSSPAREQSLGLLKLIARRLNERKEGLYPPPLKRWDSLLKAFRAGDMPYRDMHGAVVEAKGTSESIDAFARLLAMEDALDFDSVQRHRSEAVASLGGTLDGTQLEMLTKIALAYRMGKITPLAFFDAIVLRLEEDHSNKKALSQYVDYLRALSSVDWIVLKQDLEEAGEEIFLRLAQGQEKVLAHRALTDRVERLARLVELRGSREDLDIFSEEPRGLAAKAVLSDARSLIDTWETQPWMAGALDDALGQTRIFYEVALQRDVRLTENLLEEMERRGHKTALLMAGGFHTTGILEELKRQGVSYAAVLPQAGDGISRENYLALLMREDTPYLDLYRKGKRSDILSGSVGMAWPAPGPRLGVAATTFFGNLMARARLEFGEAAEDFSLQVLGDLLAGAAAIAELSPAEGIEAWREAVEERAKTEKNARVAQALRESADALQSLGRGLPPMKVSDNEVYWQVLIDGVAYVYGFFSGDAVPPVVYEASVDLDVEGVRGQLLSVDTVQIQKIQAHRTLPRKARQMGADTPKPGVLLYDIDKKQEDVGHLLGIARELRDLRSNHPNVKIVLVSTLADTAMLEENLAILGLRRDDHYDGLMLLEQEADLLAEMHSRASEIPALENENRVLITPRPEAFGVRDAEGKIAGTPVVVPKPGEANTMVSTPMLLLLARLILEHKGDIDAVVALLQHPKYRGLRAFLSDNGVDVSDEDAVRDLIRNPVPITIPTGAEEAVRAYSQFLRSA